MTQRATSFTVVNGCSTSSSTAGNRVRWGEQTWDEMQYNGMSYYVDHPAAATESAALQ